MAFVSRSFLGPDKCISILKRASSVSPILVGYINLQSVSAGHKYGTTRPADKEDIGSNSNENASIEKRHPK
jgi:hypothetical protein